MARIHLIVGPVGAGKSTFGQQLALDHRAVRLTLDEWMAVLFRHDRPEDGVMEWYADRTQRCLEQIWRVTRSALAAGTDVVLEIGLIQRRDRQRFLRRVDADRASMTIYQLDAPRAVRRERVEQRNREQGATFSMVVPPAIFELASDLWEPIDEDEAHGRDVRRVDAGG